MNKTDDAVRVTRLEKRIGILERENKDLLRGLAVANSRRQAAEAKLAKRSKTPGYIG